jgi:DnaK suppressor protein
MQFFRDLLLHQFNELLDSAEKTVNSLVSNNDWASADLLDQAAMDSDRDYMLRIRDRESRLIKKIKASLAKLDDGSYGICESCGQEITPARLRARPTTDYCIACKTQMEALEKVAGW